MPKLWPDAPEQTSGSRVRKWFGGQVAEIKAIAGGQMRFTTWGSGSWWGGSGAQWWANGGREVPDYAAIIGDGTGTSIVEPVVRWISRNAPAPIRIRQLIDPGERREVPFHGMLDLIDEPNPYYDGRTLIKSTAADLAVDGNAYWWKISSAAGRPAQLWWIPHMLIEPRWSDRDDTVYIDHYDYKPGNGNTYPLKPEEVIHFRDGIDAENTRKGRSPLKAVMREIYTDEEAARYTAALLGNMGVAGTIITPVGDRTVPEPAADLAKQRFDETTKGSKRGSTIVFGQAVDIKQFGFSPEQLNLRELRRIPEERISAVFGTPAIVAGLGAGLDRSTFANYAEAREAGYEECIIPLQGIIAATLRRQLLSAYLDDLRGYEVYFDLSDVRILQEDANALSTRTIAEVAGGIAMVSEGRRKLGYEADDDLDVFLVPVGRVPTPRADLVVSLDAQAGAPEPTPAELGA